MVASGVQDRLIARELGRAIDAQRLRVIGFNIRLRLQAIKDKIRREVDQPPVFSRGCR
jgi:hypothetical protein